MTIANRLEVSSVELVIVHSILACFIPERAVWAFGSRVNGKAKKFSDLDLAILGEEPLSIAKSADLREAFEESDLPYKVDLVDWASTSAIFRNIIQANYYKLR